MKEKVYNNNGNTIKLKTKICCITKKVHEGKKNLFYTKMKEKMVRMNTIYLYQNDAKHGEWLKEVCTFFDIK